MGRIILVTGGARSGKSTFAEGLVKNEKEVVYIATSRICDDEMQERVNIHRQNRPQEWRTAEATEELRKVVKDERYYLLDCLTIMTSNILFDLTKDMDIIDVGVQKRVEEKVVKEVEEIINKVQSIEGSLVMVTNEVGLSIVPENHVGRVYRDIIGRVNQRVAALCDEVYLVVCGLPLRIK
ncbi:bifunctional adenosylcobinamide kinase/adenosylcobinamide-phosphate guanylyltransferase [Alkaliphilus serpentinus]|uniref:Adenosylcobinamide kinase n=1 Tax=Alkaliphilus serpentinus TaxID=1482731 RepID=A0A833HRB3_9FIRM|nr:bifunctional adenosylcobinamide kinase/adenosylcobinamide-phosphate guanylyltransferase [Alkaliphilus serpentinus]KAB3532853.1 bifunctional adenosylcobinamide kinase/adenosylcobinamide-phosphate guanylyltransferase [Alkaliphilus serpentinus]